MRIAVCDDDQACLQRFQALAETYRAAHPEQPMEVFCFDRPGDLLASLHAGSAYQAFFLDILMPETDGIELGRAIHELDEDVPLFYTTSSRDFALDAFGQHALRYLLKPLQQRDLFEALDQAVLLARSRLPSWFALKCASGFMRLEMAQILYVENGSHRVFVTLQDGRQVVSSSNRCSFVEAVKPLLSGGSFIQVHKSFVVNMAHVRSLAVDTFVMEDGFTVPISRSFAADVKHRYLAFLSSHALWGGSDA